jgi:hypothetical protein
VQSSSLLDSVLLAEWEDRYERGLFRYDVTACPTKVVPGAYGFIAQLNEGRGSKKRPTEFTADKVSPLKEDLYSYLTRAINWSHFQRLSRRHAYSLYRLFSDDSVANARDLPALHWYEEILSEVGYVCAVHACWHCLVQLKSITRCGGRLHSCFWSGKVVH